MGLVERLRELEQLRKQGVITDAEYAALVANATEAAEPAVLAPPPMPNPVEVQESVVVTQPLTARVGRKKILIGAGAGVAVALIAVIGVLASSGSSGNPLDSSEYKKLLAEKAAITKEIAATRARSADALGKASTAESALATTQEEVDNFQARVDKANSILNDLQLVKS